MSTDWQVVLDAGKRTEDRRWYATHIEGVQEDVAYRYDAYTREAYSTAPRGAHRYVSAEHARQEYLKAYARHSTARALDFEAMMMRVQGGERSEPDYGRLVDLEGVWRSVLARAPGVLGAGAQADAGRAKLHVWWDFAWQHSKEAPPSPDEVLEIRRRHNERVRSNQWKAPLIRVAPNTSVKQQVNSHRKLFKSWCEQVDRIVVHELVKRRMYVVDAVDRDK
ncbi:MAG: hypothetical protein AAFW98_05870 [Pseudomonadota bacterium]